MGPLFLTVPSGVWDLSSLTRDGTCVPCSGRWSLNQPGKPLVMVSLPSILQYFSETSKMYRSEILSMLLLLTVVSIVKWCLLNIYITVMICSFPGVRSKKGDTVTHGDLLD